VGVYLEEADLRGAKLEEANLRGACLRGADVEGADLTQVNFTQTDLRGVNNLDRARGLGTAYFYKTKVTPKEEAIIKEAWKKERILVVE